MSKPKRVYAVLIPLVLVTFLVSAVGSRNHEHDFRYWVGATGWFSFCVSLLVTLAFSAYVVVTGLRRRGRSDVVA